MNERRGDRRYFVDLELSGRNSKRDHLEPLAIIGPTCPAGVLSVAVV